MKKYGRDLARKRDAVDNEIIKRYKYFKRTLSDEYRFMDPNKMTVQEMLNKIIYIEDSYVDKTNQIDMFDKPEAKKNV